jgi:hypothetical protein
MKEEMEEKRERERKGADLGVKEESCTRRIDGLFCFCEMYLHD